MEICKSSSISFIRLSAETAFFEGHGTCLIRIYTEEGVVVKEFSKKFEADGMIFEEPTDMMFSFNNPLGACPTCEGTKSLELRVSELEKKLQEIKLKMESQKAEKKSFLKFLKSRFTN